MSVLKITNYEPSAELPEGKTCKNCHWFKKCQALFGCPKNSKFCDFIPSAYTNNLGGT